MRFRPAAALSAVAVAALLLAGCSSSPEPDADPTSTPDSSADCGIDPKTGADSEAVAIEGEAPKMTATSPTDLEFAEIQRTVHEADGDDLSIGQLVSGQYLVVDPSTGEVVQDSATTSAEDSGLVPIVVNAGGLTGAAVLCTPLGSSAALTIPGSMLGEGASNLIVVVQSVDELPVRATGEDQPAADGFPTVELADDGAPAITLPGGEPPTEVQQTELKVGDGPVVQSGDMVVVQYTGVKWSDGSVFDSSWDRGEPASFQTTGVVEGFQQALEGKTVGSQVLVVIPPAAGYGEGEINDEDLVGETLVFVVDILGVQRAATQ